MTTSIKLEKLHIKYFLSGLFKKFCLTKEIKDKIGTMTNYELINELNSKTIEIYDKENLKCLRENEENDYTLKGKNILIWHSEVTRNLKQLLKAFLISQDYQHTLVYLKTSRMNMSKNGA